ncbi:MAG: response regulator [Omnitrophica WOR_2 bacterium]
MSSKHSILIIDDEPFLRSTLGAILKRVGYSTFEASTAREGFQILEERDFDLVFLDLQMPDLDGMKVLPDILERHPKTPVLILTANSSLEKAIEALRIGARDYLLKPVEPGEIITRVDDLLKEEPEQEIEDEEDGCEPSFPDYEKMNHNSSYHPGVQRIESHSARFLCQGPFSLDMYNRHAMFRGVSVELPSCAFEYLLTLLKHSPHPVSYQDLVYESQGYRLNMSEAQDLARWRIHGLRKAFKSSQFDGEYILSVPGTGYRLVIFPSEED